MLGSRRVQLGRLSPAGETLRPKVRRPTVEPARACGMRLGRPRGTANLSMLKIVEKRLPLRCCNQSI